LSKGAMGADRYAPHTPNPYIGQFVLQLAGGGDAGFELVAQRHQLRLRIR